MSWMSQPSLKNKKNDKKLFVGRITPRKNSSPEIWFHNSNPESSAPLLNPLYLPILEIEIPSSLKIYQQLLWYFRWWRGEAAQGWKANFLLDIGDFRLVPGCLSHNLKIKTMTKNFLSEESVPEKIIRLRYIHYFNKVILTIFLLYYL